MIPHTKSGSGKVDGVRVAKLINNRYISKIYLYNITNLTLNVLEYYICLRL